MARRRVRFESQQIEVNLTSALDIVFNILAFFVITFQPPKPEANFDLSLPPPKLTEATADSVLPTEEPEDFNDVTITLAARSDGSLAAIQIESRPVALGGPADVFGPLFVELERLRATVRAMDGKGISAANIVAPKHLKYGSIMGAVDACHRATITKINFVETSGARGG